MIETRKLRLLFFSFWGCGGKKGFLGAIGVSRYSIAILKRIWEKPKCIKNNNLRCGLVGWFVCFGWLVGFSTNEDPYQVPPRAVIGLEIMGKLRKRPCVLRMLLLFRGILSGCVYLL